MKRAEGLLHPLAVLAIAVLVLNDHLLKALWHDPFTGKLSDVAGMIFFPLMLQALIELADRREPFRPRRGILVGCAVATATVFSATNLFRPAAYVYRWGLGLLQWPFRALWALDDVEWVAVQHTLDPTDVFAAPFVLLAVAIGWKRCSE